MVALEGVISLQYKGKGYEYNKGRDEPINERSSYYGIQVGDLQ